jgi:hypothetical protein
MEWLKQSKQSERLFFPSIKPPFSIRKATSNPRN